MRIQILLILLLLNSFSGIHTFTQEMPLVYEVENTGADCQEPILNSFTDLPEFEYLTDPFMWSDYTGRISSSDDWRCRRAEIGTEIQYYETGTKPEAPDTMEVSYINNELRVTIIENGDTLTLIAPVSLPDGEGPFPALIGIGFFPTGNLPSDIFTDRGIATVNFQEGQLTDAWSGVRGDGAFYEMYPDKKRGKFIAWSWGVSRIIDALEETPELNIDLSRLAITGCSYAGKIALFSGAFDERIALTIAQEPGGGGDAAWRITETLEGSRETLRNAQSYHWYHEDIYQFNSAVTKLPYDHHELMAMIAPRALLVLGNPDYEWLAEESGHIACKAAHEVWKALGVPDRFGFSKVGGEHNHCELLAVQRPEVIAFVEKFLLGNNSANTDVAISPYNPDIYYWIVWPTPDLVELSSVNDPEKITGQFNLIQNYPNPFYPVTTISYSLDRESDVQISVYDITGKKIKTMLNKKQNAGKYELIFDGSDLVSGFYYYVMEVDGFTTSRKMLLLR